MDRQSDETVDQEKDATDDTALPFLSRVSQFGNMKV
jgi:hypothetical protein